MIAYDDHNFGKDGVVVTSLSSAIFTISTAPDSSNQDLDEIIDLDKILECPQGSCHENYSGAEHM